MRRRRVVRGRPQFGLAVVELVVCLPPILLLVFVSIECCSMIFVKRALTASTYEAARVAIQKASTSAQVVEVAEEILSGHGISGTTVTCEPANIAAVLAGERVTVVATASCDANRISPPLVFSGQTIEVRTTMAKER